MAHVITRAIEVGKHIYREKPVADSLDKATEAPAS
jgi:predicted dehydrogenase